MTKPPNSEIKKHYFETADSRLDARGAKVYSTVMRIAKREADLHHAEVNGNTFEANEIEERIEVLNQTLIEILSDEEFEAWLNNNLNLDHL